MASSPPTPAVAGLLQHRAEASRHAELCLCTLAAQTLELRPLDTLLSDAAADTVRLPLRSAYVYAAGAGALTLALTDTGERHHLAATGRSGEAQATGTAWLQRLAAACGGDVPAEERASAEADGADVESIAQWLRLARDGQRSKLVKAYRAQPGLLDARATSGAGLGALHWAAAKAGESRRHRECLEWLLRVGARTDLPAAGGRPVLHAAGTVGVARLLVAAGAEPACVDGAGRSAPEAARELGLGELASWLESAALRAHASPAPEAAGAGAADLEAAPLARQAVRVDRGPVDVLPPSPVVELKGVGSAADGWYSLHGSQRTDRPTYTRVHSAADPQPAMLSYHPPAADELTGWWFVATTTPLDLEQAPRPEGLLASSLVALVNDSAGSPEKICAGWQRRVRTGDGVGSLSIRFCGEEALLIDTVCCGTASIAGGETLCLPLSHRSAVEFLLQAARWQQLGLSELVESECPTIADLEALKWLRGALTKVGSARRSLHGVAELQSLGAALGSAPYAADLLMTMERGLLCSLARLCLRVPSGLFGSDAAAAVELCDEALTLGGEEAWEYGVRLLRAQAVLRVAAEETGTDECSHEEGDAHMEKAARSLQAQIAASDCAARRPGANSE